MAIAGVMAWGGFQSAAQSMNRNTITVTNGVAEAVIRPDIGRIISFRRSGGENRLWVAEDPFAFRTPMPIYGGLRIMISPEILWEQIRWPRRSDPATDGGPWTVLEQTARRVSLCTFSKDLGVKVGWTVSLHETEAELLLEYDVERVEENPFPVHLWSIAQVPLQEVLYIDRLPHTEKRYHDFLRTEGMDAYMVYLPEAGVFRFSGSGQTVPLKAGTFGRWIAHLQNRQAFVICAPEPLRLPYIDNSNLQAFSYGGKFPFYEMEVTSPMYMLRLGESFQTSEKWMLLDLPEEALPEQLRFIHKAVSESP